MRTISVAVVAGLVARLHQLVGELARAQHQPPGRRPRPGGLRSLRMRRKWLSPVKSAAARHRQLVPQQRLGRHHDQRLAEIAQHLPPQDVEIIGRRGAVGDLDIVLGAQLQIALEPRRAMLRPLPFEAVRQQHHQAAGAQPLGLARGDELVDDHLRAVGEIAELRFPQHQRLRVGDRIAIFEAEHAEFGQRAVADLEAAGARSCASGMYFSPVCLVDPHRVALAEGAAAAVLARQADAVALREQAAEGQRLGGRPVEALAAVEHRLLGLEDPAQRLVDGEARREPWSAPRRAASSCVVVDRGGDVAAAEHRLVGPAEPRPAALEPVGLVGQIAGRRLRTRLRGCSMKSLVVRVDPRLVDDALGDQPLAVDLADRRMLAGSRRTSAAG